MTASITIQGCLSCDPVVTTTERGTTFAYARLRNDHDGHSFDWPLMASDEAALAPFRSGDTIEVSGRLKARRMGSDSRTNAVLPFLNDPRCYFLVFVEQVARVSAAEAACLERATPADAAQPASASRPKIPSPRRRNTSPAPTAAGQSPLGL